MDLIFNILIRTSERPGLFSQCVKSVELQDYENYKIIVSADTKRTLEYVKNYDVEIVRTVWTKRRTTNHCPWNGYFNNMLRVVDPGWVIYLDDDATLVPGALKEITERVKKNKLLIWKYRFANGRVIPEKQFWGARPTRQHIDTGCFAHHTSHRVKWDNARAADYRVARNLYTRLGAEWYDKVLVEAANNGDNGKRNDSRHS